ncbi:MAG: Gfo/Idh/MocA family protein [Tepidisphaerales bacterium]
MSHISRRTLLKSSTVLAAPLIVPSTVFGRAAPSNKIHLAMFGVGTQGVGDMRNFAGNDDARFIMVCDPFKSRREAAAKYLNGIYKDDSVVTTSDYREVMDRDDIDAIVAATPDYWHVPLALAAAVKGKDSYIEKPLSCSLAWSIHLRQVMQRHGRIMQYGTQQRSSRTFRYACEVVRNGYLGKIKHIDAWCADGTRAKPWMTAESLISEPVPADIDYENFVGPAPFFPYSHFRTNREGHFHCYEYSIGFLGGWGAHPLDIAQWGMGADNTSPVEYSGTGRIPTQGMYSTVYDWDINCRYASGATLHFMSTKIGEPVFMKYRRRNSDHGTTFFGEDGWLSVDRGGMEASDPRFLSIRLKPTDTRLVVSNSHARNFLDCIRTREQPISHLEAAIRSDTISHMSDLTVRLGRPIHWDPAREVVVNDETANRMLRRAMRPPFVF